MKLVLVCGQYKILEQKLKEIKTVILSIEKTVPPYIYFEVTTELTTTEVIEIIKTAIYQDKNTWQFDFQIYGFYNGKIDFLGYLSKEKKDAIKYYK